VEEAPSEAALNTSHAGPHYETRVAASISMRLQFSGIPLPRSDENRSILDNSIRLSTFAATGVKDIAVGKLRGEAGTLLVPITYSISALLIGDRLSENRTMSQRDEVDIGDVVQFTERAAIKSINYVESFISRKNGNTTSGVPMIDCTNVTRDVLYSPLCENWRLDSQISAGNTSQGLGRRAAGEEHTPSFLLVLQEALLASHGEMFDYKAVRISMDSSSISIASNRSIVGEPPTVGPEVPQATVATVASPVTGVNIGLVAGCAVGVTSLLIAAVLAARYFSKRPKTIGKVMSSSTELVSSDKAHEKPLAFPLGAPENSGAVSLVNPLASVAHPVLIVSDTESTSASAVNDVARSHPLRRGSSLAPAPSLSASSQVQRSYKKLVAVEENFLRVKAKAVFVSSIAAFSQKRELDDLGAALLVQRAWRARRMTRMRSHYDVVARFDKVTASSRFDKVKPKQEIQQEQLPAGWSVHSEGTDVWYTHQDGRSQWDMPHAGDQKQQLPTGWSVHSEGTDVWYTHQDGRSQWEKPLR